MTAAIFGLLGVLVGGLLNSVSAAALDRRRQLLEGMAAARLVSGELRALGLEVDWMIKSGWGNASPEISTAMWETYRAALASVLSFVDWERVVHASTVADQVNQFVREAKPELSPGELETLKIGTTEITKARALLNDVGDGSRLTRTQKVLFRLTGGWLKGTPPAGGEAAGSAP